MAIDTVVEEVAANLEEAAEATRRINTTHVGYFLGGCAVGFAIGFYWGYKFNKEKIKAEAFAKSEEEVEKIRKVYQAKAVAATPKPDLEEIVEEQGYDRPERPLKAPVPGVTEPVTPEVHIHVPTVPPPVPPRVVYDGGKDKNRGWNYTEELEHREQLEVGAPYVIHQDEFNEEEKSHYGKVTYTYYAGDDVLVDDENEQPVPHGDINVGIDNLKFGHGTDDVDVVFVRNDRLELDMEICRTHESYEQVVLGIGRDEDDES